MHTASGKTLLCMPATYNPACPHNAPIKNSRFIVKPDSYPDELLFLSIRVDCSPVTVFRFGHLLLYTVISCKEATLIEILVYSVRTLPHHLHVLRQCCLSRSFTNNFMKVFRCAANWLHRVLLLKRRVAT